MNRKYEYRRRLPHFQQQQPIFVTFCTFRRWILPPAARDIVLEACLRGNGDKFQLHAAVVMPDHVHLILTPLGDQNGPVPMQHIMQAIKGASAHLINHHLGRTGPVWQAESFDRVLRSEDNLESKVGYIVANPIRAGLVESADAYKWIWSDLV